MDSKDLLYASIATKLTFLVMVNQKICSLAHGRKFYPQNSGQDAHGKDFPLKTCSKNSLKT